MSDFDDMVADILATREELRCPCGAPCDFSHGLCDACEQWAATLEGAA